MIKPDAVQRGLTGKIIQRFEEKGLKITGLKMLRVSLEQAERQYLCHKGKAFYDTLITFILSGPCVVLVVEGKQAIEIVRKLMGATDPLKAEPGTIRGDFSNDIKHNLIHASDSQESFQHEMPIYFTASELCEHTLALQSWINFE
jgi:nucleoside-diphosphate kinase